MDQERWRRIEDVFHWALTTPEASRTHLLDEACLGDPDLRREVEALLANDASAQASIRSVLGSEAEHLAADARGTAIGQRLGPYRLRALLGEGGMGAVYLAERADTQFVQDVAIKILPHAIGSPLAVARFRDERQILAALEHKNIVRLLDGGSTAGGLPYLVMEHIEGVPITTYANEQALSIRARVQLVREVCAALHHAHQNLIVHRDIKPGNILVDATGTPKLLDFGIAKLLSPVPGFEREAMTRTGHAPFTPGYASPEQARGKAVSTATDVYSVGAVLYELVAGQPPHQATGDLLDVIHLICEVEPARPRLVAPPELRRELSSDLEAIILKALHKELEQRYRSVEQLADDLDRYLEGRPVQARTATLAYRARKLIGRNKVAALASALVVTALVASTVISLRSARRAEDEATRARFAEIAIWVQEVLLRTVSNDLGAAETQLERTLTNLNKAQEQARQAAEDARKAEERAKQAKHVAHEAEKLAERARKEMLVTEARAKRARRETREAEERTLQAELATQQAEERAAEARLEVQQAQERANDAAQRAHRAEQNVEDQRTQHAAAKQLVRNIQVESTSWQQHAGQLQQALVTCRAGGQPRSIAQESRTTSPDFLLIRMVNQYTDLE